MPGARRRGRLRTARIDNIKSWTGLSVEESVRMTEERDKYGESTSMVWPTLVSRTAKVENRTFCTRILTLSNLFFFNLDCVRLFAPPDLSSFVDLCREADDTLFNSIRNNSHHVLRHLRLPPSQASQHYSLRSRRHYLQLSMSQSSLIDGNFLHRMLHTYTY